MDLKTLGFYIDMVGEISIAVAAVMVHRRLGKDHKVDKRVERLIAKEELVAMVGILGIIVGSFLQMYAG